MAAMNRRVAVGATPQLGAPRRIAAVRGRERVALQALHRLRKLQQAAVWRTVRVVADGAVLDDRWMLEDLWPLHVLVTSRALFVLAGEAGFPAAVRVVAIDTGQSTFPDRVMRGHGHACGDVLVAVHAQLRMAVGLPHADVDFLDLGRVQSVAVAAVQPGLPVRGKIPVHALVVPALMASEAVRGRRQRHRAASPFDKMPFLRRVADHAIAVVDVDLVSLVGNVAGLAAITAYGNRDVGGLRPRGWRAQHEARASGQDGKENAHGSSSGEIAIYQ